jgi:hypothetical protein
VWKNGSMQLPRLQAGAGSGRIPHPFNLKNESLTMPSESKYCCLMRRHFIFGIIGERAGEDAPVDTADFIVQWEPKPIIGIKFCPFCGKAIDASQEMRVTGLDEEEDDES